MVENDGAGSRAAQISFQQTVKQTRPENHQLFRPQLLHYHLNTKSAAAINNCPEIYHNIFQFFSVIVQTENKTHAQVHAHTEG